MTDSLPTDNRPYRKPLNGFDATKKHFEAAYAKWERAVQIMVHEGSRMAVLGGMLVEEAQACHKWVGQVGTKTAVGYDGRMKNYDAFKDALQKVKNLVMKAPKTVEEVDEPTKKWTVEFICQRRAWDEEEEDADNAEEEVFDESGGDAVEQAVIAHCFIKSGY